MSEKEKIVYRFKAPRNSNGRAKYRLEFVPTRDLTERDVERLTKEERDAVDAATMPNGNKLYAKVGRRGKSKADADDIEDIGDEEIDEELAEEVEEELPGEAPVEDGEPEVGAE